MKKILSAILALTMILALVAAMGISVSAADAYESAKDGDVLYEVNFKGDDTYSPSIFYCAVENALEVVPSDDGSSVTATYLSSTKGRAFFGGTVNGLTYGEGKTYTISMKVAIAYTTKEDGSISSGNGGVFINMPKNTDPEFIQAEKFNDRMFGYYGCPNLQHIFSYGAGNKATSSLKSSNSGYFKENLATVDENGFVDLTFVVDGKNMKIFINNSYIDEANVFTEGMVDAAGNIGISAYLYNTNASITIKDAKIYKGNLVTNPTYPDYYVKGELAAEYDTAKTGDLLFAADFTRKDTVFAPRVNSDKGDMITVTFDPEDKSYIKFQHSGSDGAVYYGSQVAGLEVDSETRYTTEWKVKSGSGNSGLCFATPTGLPYKDNAYNIYGTFIAGKQFSTQHGGAKITNSVLPAENVGSNGYTTIADLATDADGFATIRTEMYGYDVTVYYLNTEGQWIKYNQFNMTNTTKIDGSTTYAHDTGFQLCVAFYLYNKNMSAEYKDINIYKGLIISDPEGKLDPVEPAKPLIENAVVADFTAFKPVDETKKESSYVDRYTDSGWTASSARSDTAEYTGNAPMITLNGKTSAPGKLTSAVIPGGIGQLAFNYGFAFTDTQVSLTINLKKADGTVIKSETIEKTDLTKETVYSCVLDFNVAEDVVIEIVNNCLSGSNSNKDRVGIWNLSWNAPEVPETTAPETTEPAPETTEPTETPTTGDSFVVFAAIAAVAVIGVAVVAKRREN